MSRRCAGLNWPFAAGLALLALVGWLVSLSIHAPGAVSGWWAIAWIAPSQALGAGLRLPGWNRLPISRSWTRWFWPELTTPIDKHLTWLLVWTTHLYALCTLSQVSGSLTAMLPALLSALTVEWLVWPWAPTSWRQSMSWLSNCFNAQSDQDSEQIDHSIQEGDTQTVRLLEVDRVGQGELADPAGSIVVEREQTRARLADGQSIQQGWVLVDLVQQQKTAAISCLFSPPYVIPPSVELDWEVMDEQVEDFEARLEHVTPAGMRVTLKRRQAAQAVEVKLHWTSK